MTSFSVSIDPDALENIQEITNWYANRSPALSDKFQAQVTKHILSLRGNPLLYAPRRGNVRFVSMQRFPYQIIFLVDVNNKKVRVLNVLHKNSNSKNHPRS